LINNSTCNWRNTHVVVATDRGAYGEDLQGIPDRKTIKPQAIDLRGAWACATMEGTFCTKVTGMDHTPHVAELWAALLAICSSTVGKERHSPLDRQLERGNRRAKDTGWNRATF